MVVHSAALPSHSCLDSFSAPSVEPYGGSSSLAGVIFFYFTFSAPSVEPYGGSWPLVALEGKVLDFQCSLCRAVWWFSGDGGLLETILTSFSAPSVEPYGGSNRAVGRGSPGNHFQCSLCRAVWWFPAGVGRHRRTAVGFQCSLCRAVWWFEFTLTQDNKILAFQCSLCRAVWWFRD